MLKATVAMAVIEVILSLVIFFCWKIVQYEYDTIYFCGPVILGAFGTAVYILKKYAELKRMHQKGGTQE